MSYVRPESDDIAGAARVAVAGPPGIDRDIVMACLRKSGFDASVIAMSELRSEKCAVLLLLEPRVRDWETAVSLEIPVVLVHTAELTTLQRASFVLRGADAFVSVGATTDELYGTVKSVLEGGSIIDPFVTRVIARALRRHGVGLSVGFSQRELTIIEGMQRGQSAKEVAQVLGLSVRTVHVAQRRLFEKIGARNRAHALTLIHDGQNDMAFADGSLIGWSGDSTLTRSG
jgi:DNA-binding CsgD family transcriptional regulator